MRHVLGVALEDVLQVMTQCAPHLDRLFYPARRYFVTPKRVGNALDGRNESFNDVFDEALGVKISECK